MEPKAENIIDFPQDLRKDMRSVADNIANASENLKRSASILQLRSTQPNPTTTASSHVHDALIKAQELTKNAKTLSEQINLLSSNLLK
jgi:hypothetical protein